MGGTFRAQLVMRREDGASILDAKPGHGDVSPPRAEAIRQRLAQMGFRIEEGNLNTLSVVGPAELFARSFGMHEDSATAGAALSSSRIPGELADIVAGVFFVPAPELF